MVEVTTDSYNGVRVVFIGTSHWELSPVVDALQEAQPDVICAEARPSHGFDSRNDQEAVQSELKRRGTPVVMIDSEARTASKEEAMDKYGKETLEAIDNASSRDEVQKVAPDFYQEIIDREGAMVTRLKGVLDRDIEVVAVVVGALHVEGIRSSL